MLANVRKRNLPNPQHCSLTSETQHEEMSMNKDQIKGAVRDLGGKIQEEAGKLVGSKEQQAKGLQNQLAGKVQQNIGNLEKAVKDAGKKL